MEENTTPKMEYKLIWNKMAPMKVKVHAWKIIYEWLPTKVCLQRRNSLPNGVSISCPFCEKKEESVRYILFVYDFSYKVWMEVLKWIGVNAALFSLPANHLLHISSLLIGKKGKMLMSVIWECSVWVLWKARNAFVFRGEKALQDKILEDIKIFSWSWLSSVKWEQWTGIFEEWNLCLYSFVKYC